MKQDKPNMPLHRGIYMRIFFLSAIIFINFDSIKAQRPQLRSIMGIQAEWKGMDLGLLNMNFFSSEGNWFQNNTRLTADFKSNGHFRLGMGYQYEYVELKDRIRHENRPMLFLHYLKKWADLELKSLSTMEFRIIEGDLENRYRNELGLYFKQWNITQPFILTEAFINLDKLQYVRQRTTLGTKFLIDNLNLILFGFHETTRIMDNKWANTFAVGIVGIFKLSKS